MLLGLKEANYEGFPLGTPFSLCSEIIPNETIKYVNGDLIG